MFFASPWWLIGLGPVVGLAVYLLRGKPNAAVVPFLQLWQKPATQPRVRSSVRFPPLYVILLLISMLLAVLSAAQPVWNLNRTNGSITIILDRGITMSPKSADGLPYRGVLKEVSDQSKKNFANCLVQFIPVPGDAQPTDAEHWLSIASALKPTALDTQTELNVAIANQRRKFPNQPIIVLSDCHLMTSNDSVMQISSTRDVSNIGISLMAARTMPVPQLMVQLRNHSTRRNVQLLITAGAKKIEQFVSFQANDETKSVFIDLPSPVPDVIEAQLNDAGDASLTHSAWLVRNHPSPKIDVVSALPPAVEKFIKAYSATNSSDENSPRVAVTTGDGTSDRASLQLLREASQIDPPGIPTIADHALTKAVSKWPGPADANATAPNGYKTIVLQNDKPIVAVQDLPVQKVWVNLSIENWSATPDFVIFFTNVLDWLGQKQDQAYRFQLPGRLEGSDRQLGWWPGLYKRSDGESIAINPPDVQWTEIKTKSWNQKLSRATRDSAAATKLSPAICAVALVFAMAGLAMWPRTKQN